MTTMNCAACKLWAKTERGEAGWRTGMGKCTNIPMFFDATEDVSAFDPEDCGDGAGRTLKPEFKSVKAVALDGSGYRAELLTAPDFGCVSFVPRV
jgi:hypothetical protein